VIYLRLSNNVILNTLGVPIIYNFEHLAEQLSLSKGLLYYLSYKKEYCYSESKIPKKNGTLRTIYAPILPLKVVQKWILTEILEKINVSEQSMAFVPRKNGLRTNAEYHRKNIFLLEMDITNFFNTIKEHQVYSLFSNIGYGIEVSSILTNLCTFKGELPQGAVTSPYIANLTCYHLDSRLNGLCSRRDVVYTRYADDLSFSSNNRMLLNKIENFIKYIIEDEGFKINDKKTRYLSNDVKKTITGITINNEEIHVDKIMKKNLRALIFSSIKNMDYSKNDKIRGTIAYIDSIEIGFKEKIIKYLINVVQKPMFKGNLEIVNTFNRNKLFKELPDMHYIENPFL
jgi:Retron-type reverse transcriptase